MLGMTNDKQQPIIMRIKEGKLDLLDIIFTTDDPFQLKIVFYTFWSPTSYTA